MSNIFSYKLHTKDKAVLSILTVLMLVISIALPLLPASAATASFTLATTSGPNGTSVKVTGSGFAAGDTAGMITILVDGLSGKTDSNLLVTNSSGFVSGTFTIGGAGALNLVAGTHSVQISDTIAAPQAQTFTITVPTVTLTPATGPAGTSVLVTGSGFSKLSGNVITAASFAGTSIAIASGTVTADWNTLSSNSISTGTFGTGGFKATVSLPAITDPTNSSFTLIDNQGNVATTTWALNVPTVTLSPTIGKVGSVVTATLSGFGPGAQITTVTTVMFGTTAITTLAPTTPVVTEQGTAVFQFVVPANTVDSKVGARTVTVSDSNGNMATASFTIVPSVTVTLGDATTNTMLPYAPAATANVVAYLTATGFKNNTALVVTGGANVPTGWLTFTSLMTDANGAVATAAMSAAGTSPASGIYSMTVSDGTTSVQVMLTIAIATGDFLVITPGSAASGSQATLTAFIAAGGNTGNILFDGGVVNAGFAAVAWPTVSSVNFNVPPSGAGPHTITAVGMPGASATFTNTGAAAISVVVPSPAAVGTYVTIVGSGFANNPSATVVAFSINGLAITPLDQVFTAGSIISVFMVPAFPAGTYAISVTDSGYNTATASLTTTIASVTVSPDAAVLYRTTGSTSISLTGSGFPMGQAITVTLDSTPLAAATIGCTATNTNGGIIIYTTAIPSQSIPAGPHTITVTAGTASVTTTFTNNPTISIAPTALRAGAITAIEGHGFAATSALSVALSGTAMTWFNNTATGENVTTVTSLANGDIPSSVTIPTLIIPATTEPGTYTVSVTDASGNTASKTLTVLAPPSITLAAPQAITSAVVGFAGAGFTPGSGRVATANLMSGTTVVSALVVTSPITVNSTGGWTVSNGYTITLPAVVAPGTYTVQLTLAAPTETASATLVILGTPTVTINPTTSYVGGNVSITIIGLGAITTATLGSQALTLESTTVPTSGANAYNLTTTFLVPTVSTGSYTVLVGDGTRSATTTIDIAPAITLAPTAGIIKGSTVTVTGHGFAFSTAFTLSVNGVTIAAAAGTSMANGSLVTSFAVPITATATSTVVVTDANSNSATATFDLTAPTVVLSPDTVAVGSTVQIIASGYRAGSAVVIQIGGMIVNTAPASIMTDSTGSFIAYATVPAGLTGNVTVTAIDSSNNVGMGYFTVGGTSGVTPNQAVMSSTAQTTNAAGQATTSFTQGSTVKVSFVLQSNTGSGNVVCAVTFQQGAKVYNFASAPAAISTVGSTVSFTNLLPAGVTGTWTATLQVYASDGTTPLAVAVLTFTVS